MSNQSPDAAKGTSSIEPVGRSSSAPPALLRKRCPACGERYPNDFWVCPRDATQLTELLEQDADPLLGSVVGDTYQVLRAIGEGGMGRVYEARHTRLFSKRFAIKVLHSDLTRQPEVVGRFLREAEATSALNHPNIVGVLDVNQVPDGRPYIVAELLEGDQLGDYLERNGKLSVREAISIVRPICKALIAAHDKGIVHRDIKPENLFLVGSGAQRTVKVLDFGISRVGDAAGSLTKTGMVMGTPAYMPPEQARGARVDHRADVYSVGAILYETVTGKAPFDGTDPVSTLGAVLTQEPPRAHTLVADLPPGLEQVIEKAMAKWPDARYATMRELDAALAQFDPSVSDQPGPALQSPQPSAADPSASLWRSLRHAWNDAPAPPEHARASLITLSIAAAAYLLAGFIELITSTLRVVRPESALTGSEIVLCALGSTAVSLVLGMIWAQYLFWHVWPKTERVIAVLARTRHVLLASLATYGAGKLLVHLFAGALRPTPSGVGWPGWNLMVFPLALTVACVVAWLSARSPKA